MVIYSTKQFLWLKDEKEFVADASDLYVDKDGRKVSGTGDFQIQSHKTNKLITVHLVHVAVDEEGDVKFWHFHVTTDGFTDIQVKVFND
jgi:hypothetical protein